MMLAQKIAGFDDNQADTYLRKGVSKKKIHLIELCKEWFIYGKPKQDEYGHPILGGINNGYNEKELLELWNDIEKNSSYLFNKSHATSYSLLTVITAYLKCYFPLEYFAAVLSFEEVEEKKSKYISLLREKGVNIIVPPINKIKRYFSININTNTIYYGLESIKGIGEAIIDPIIEGAPYESLEEATNRMPKTIFKKGAVEALILSGAFDSEINSIFNRNKLLNNFYELRKDKCRVEEDMTRLDIIKNETSYLGTSLSLIPWFDKYKNGEKIINAELIIDKVDERYDKKGRLMAFAKTHDVAGEYENIELLIFASKYTKYIEAFDLTFGNKILVSGKKDGQKIIIDTAQKVK